MGTLIVARHTETILNDKNIFTGSLDIPLSKRGITQAQEMVSQLENIDIDVVFVSSLFRTKETVSILLSEYQERREKCAKPIEFPVFSSNYKYSFHTLPVSSDPRLNERSYGILEGMPKSEAVERFGQEQIYKWRRGWNEAPQGGESLKDVTRRVYSFLQDKVSPLLQSNKNILVVCHQNSMRAIDIIINKIAEENVEKIEFSNGQMIRYNINDIPSIHFS